MESTVFEIPIEEFKKEIEKGKDDEKKKAILDLFTNHIEIITKREFRGLQSMIKEACKQGDLELLEILLSKKVEIPKSGIIIKINQKKKTASLLKFTKRFEEYIVPKYIKYDCEDYLITSIINNSFGYNSSVKSLQFDEQSSVRTIYTFSIDHSTLELNSIYIPKSLVEFKYLWVSNQIKEITISPLNNNFLLKENKYLLTKSDINNTDFDVLLCAYCNIKEITIPSSIKKIGPYSFSNNENLTKVEFEQNSKLEIIDYHAFFGTNISEIIFPSSIKKISKEAFGNCRLLKTVKFPEDSNLQEIDEYAFYFTHIEEFYAPKNIPILGQLLCHTNSIFKKIVLSPLDNNYILKENKYLLTKSDTNNNDFDVFLYAFRDIKEVLIPSNVKIIKKLAFSLCKDLTKIEFAENSKLEIIEEKAFLLCEKLKSIKFQENINLKKIDICAFEESGLSEISIPKTVLEICQRAFCGCENLQKVEIPEDSLLEKIGNGVFVRTNLQQLFIPPNLTELGDCFFGSFPKFIVSPLNNKFSINDKYLLKKSDTNDYDVLVYAICKDIDELIIPSNIRVIGKSAFKKSNIKKIAFSKDSKLEIIEKLAFYSSQITEISIPSTVTKICESAFERSCIQNVEIPKDSKLEIIEENAFFLSNINEIYIPSKVKKICKETFKACKNFQKVEIPENSDMQVISRDAFFASHLEQISFPRNLKELNQFYYCLKRLTKIIVSPLNNNFIFKDNKYLLTKSDPNTNIFDVLLFARRDIHYAKIPSNIKIISKYAFNKCKQLLNVDFSENSKIQVIGKYAFWSMQSNEKILIPSTVTKIGNNAFYRCKGLESFNLSDNSKLKIGDEVLGFTDIRQLYVSDVKLFNIYMLDSALILEFADESMLDCFDNGRYFTTSNTIITVQVKTNNI